MPISTYDSAYTNWKRLSRYYHDYETVTSRRLVLDQLLDIGNEFHMVAEEIFEFVRKEHERIGEELQQREKDELR